MQRQELPVSLKRDSDGSLAPALLLTALTPGEIGDAEDEWLPFLRTALAARQPATGQTPVEHKHWQWRRKAAHYIGQNDYGFVGVRADNALQGMMLVSARRAARLPTQAGMPMFYVDYIAAAPWNLRTVTAAPRFRGVGRLLIEAVIALSDAAGYAGRFGLHSLPQAESFYRDVCAMTDAGRDPAEYNLCYFEKRGRGIIP